MPSLDLDRLIAGWRGPLLAALVALIAVLPGLAGMPALDRTEARFAQASAQMLESGEFAEPRFQDRPTYQVSPLVHWLQAASVKAFSSAEARDIWAYRLPSLLGAMLAAAACAWGAASFWGQRAGVAAGVVLAASFLMSTEGFIAKADALLVSLLMVAMAALARLYARGREGEPLERRWKLLFWGALAASLLVKGPVALLIAGLTLAALAVWDRKAAWMLRLGWAWGLIMLAAALGPWLAAVTVATDGDYWRGALSDLWRGMGGDGRHLGWPGVHLLSLPLLFFPGALLLVAALITAWRRRQETGVRFAVAWLVPAWILFELTPAKLPHYVLPLYPALAWLAAAALTQPLPRRALWGGVALSAVAAVAWSVVCIWLLGRYGNASDQVYVTAALGFLLVSVFVGGWFMVQREVTTALMLTCALGVLAHAAVAAGLAPGLKALWPSDRVVRTLERTGLEPRGGLVPGPVALAGFAPPSLIFLLGTQTEAGGVAAAAGAVAEGRPAVVEARSANAFVRALADHGLKAQPEAEIRAYDYARGEPISLIIYRPGPPEGAQP